MPTPEPYDPDDDYEWYTCNRCGGEGEILVCCDDMCHGQGWCMHGDGMATCPECKGSGEVPPLTAAKMYPGKYTENCVACAGMGCDACAVTPNAERVDTPR